MKPATQGNVFGGFDEVRVRANGSCRVKGHTDALQLNIFGEVEVARTLRNPWTEAREAEDERKGLTAR